MLGGLILLMVAWAVFSIARLPPLDGPPPPREGGGILDILSIAAIALFAFAAVQLVRFFRYRGETILLATAAAIVLLAEALIAILVSQNWHYSWWEWHLLLLAAFLTIALAARNEYQRRGSLTGAFGGLYLEATLARVDRWYAGAVASVAAAQAAGSGTDDVLAELRSEGATDQELTLLSQTAREVSRLDASFRPYLPSVVTERIRHRATSSPVATIGDERVVTAMFADLAGYTTFSERHEPREVVAMLNANWAAVVPIVDRAGGTIEHFAGDGVLTVFNAAGNQPDHAAAGRARRDRDPHGHPRHRHEPSGLADLPDRHQHGARRRGRHRNRGPAELRRHRRPREHRRSLAGGGGTGAGGRRPVDLGGAR